MSKLKFVFLLSYVIVLRITEDSDVIGSHEPVNVTVGHDIILSCHLKPPFDVTTLTVEWRCNKTIVHVYKNRKDSPVDQHENFRGRTSPFHHEMVKGNISLKLTNVTFQDAGNYTCFVPKLDSQVRRGYINLIVEPEEETNRGNQTNPVEEPDSTNHHSYYGFLAVFALIPIAIAVTAKLKKRWNNNPDAGRGTRGQPVLLQVLQTEGTSAGRDGNERNMQNPDDGQENSPETEHLNNMGNTDTNT